MENFRFIFLFFIEGYYYGFLLVIFLAILVKHVDYATINT